MLPKVPLFDIIFLPVILFIGCITSLEDFLISKIRNRWILIGLLYSFIVYLFSWILYMLATKKFLAPILGYITSYLIWNFDKWCINLLISTIVAYLLWHFKMWAAGDAKLFICYSSLIPMGQYQRVYFNYYFASFLLLLAIFIPATLFLFLHSTTYLIKRFNLNEVRERLLLTKEKLVKFNKIEVGKVFLGFFVLFLLFRAIRKEFRNLIYRIIPNQNVLILVSLVAFKPLSRFFKKETKFLIIASIVLIIYLAIKVPFSKEQFILEIANISGRTLLIMGLFPIFKKIVDLYTEKTAQKTTPFAIWMFLGTLITWFL